MPPLLLPLYFAGPSSPQVNADIRLAAALRFKNRLRNEDWNADKSPVQEDEKVMVKKAMVSAVIAAPSKVRNVLLEGLRRILEYDFPDRWPGLVEEVMQYLQGQDMHKITGALSVLRVLCKRFEYKPEGEDAPLDNVVNKCFPLLIQMFQYINGLPNIAPEIAFMQKLLCKIYWSATNMRIPPLFFSNAQHFAQWLDCFLQVSAVGTSSTPLRYMRRCCRVRVGTGLRPWVCGTVMQRSCDDNAQRNSGGAPQVAVSPAGSGACARPGTM